MCFVTSGFAVLGSFAAPNASANDLPMVAGFSAAPDMGASIHLTWNDVLPADHGDGWGGWIDYYYQLFRYNPTTGVYDHIASPDEVVDYWDSGIPIGVEQLYRIRAKATHEIWGTDDYWYSDFSYASATAYWIPGAPENLQAMFKTPVLVEVRYDVVLTWDCPSGLNMLIDSYKIYKGTLAGQLAFYDEVSSSVFDSPYYPWYIDKPTDGSHVLEPGKTYYYRVSAVIDGVEGALSPVASVRIPSPQPPASLTATSFGDAVFLAWTKPIDPEGGWLPQADYYLIYRGISPNSIDECIANRSALAVYWYGMQYVDQGVTPGGTYFYQMRATSMLGTSAPSSWVSAYVPVAPTLDVSVDTSDMYFPYQLASFDVLFSYQGVPVDPTTRCAQLYGTFRHGAPWIDEVRVDTGFYRYSTTFPGAPAAPITLVVNASLETESGTCYGCEMKPLPTGTNIEDINAYLESIANDIAWISSAVGDLQFNMAALDAKVVDVDGDVATLDTDFGEIKTDIGVIDTKLVSISDGVATVQTSLGTLQVWLYEVNAGMDYTDYTLTWIGNYVSNLTIAADEINAKLTGIDGRLATIGTDIGIVKVDVADIRAQVTDINGRTATIKTDIGDLNVDVHWINATIMKTIGQSIRIKTTVGMIDVDKDKVDTDYIPWVVEPKNGVNPAMYVGMAILAMSLLAAGALTRGPVKFGEDTRRPSRCVGHSDVGVRKYRQLRTR